MAFVTDCLLFCFFTGPPTHSVGGQYCFPCWRLSSSSSVGVCNTSRKHNVTHQGAARVGGPVVLCPVSATSCFVLCYCYTVCIVLAYNLWKSKTPQEMSYWMLFLVFVNQASWIGWCLECTVVSLLDVDIWFQSILSDAGDAATDWWAGTTEPLLW